MGNIIMPDLRDAKHAIWDLSDNNVYVYRDVKHVIRGFRDNIVYIYLFSISGLLYIYYSLLFNLLLSDRFQK